MGGQQTVDKRRLMLLGRLATGSILDLGCHDLPNPYLSKAIGITGQPLLAIYSLSQEVCHLIT